MDTVLAKAVTGIYVGRKEENLLQFLGIHYAETPRRWKRAAKLAPSDKRITALEYGQECWQDVAPEEYPAGNPPMSEDCLTLNVYTAGLEGKKPVFVFIHGGCYMTGGNRKDCYGGVYCGDNLVRENPDIVYVNINYRVGILGSCDLSAFEGGEAYPDSTDLQTYDQLRALEWIHENIAAFGGDPDNITVAGQSAGSYSVFMLLAIPEAVGYFHKAICQSSAPLDSVMKTREISAEMSRRFVELTGMSSVEQLLDAPAAWVVDKGMELCFSGYRTAFEPVLGRGLLGDSVERVYESGLAKHIPVLSGTVSGEYDTMTYNAAAEDIRRLIHSRAEVSEEQIERFIANDPQRDELTALKDMFNDVGLRRRQILATEALIRGGNTAYVYYIDYTPAGSPLRTQHTFEIPYVTGTEDAVIHMDFRANAPVLGDRPDPVLKERLQGAFLSFVRKGDPNCGELFPAWPAYTLEGRETMLIAPEWEASGEIRPEDSAIMRMVR